MEIKKQTQNIAIVTLKTQKGVAAQSAATPFWVFVFLIVLGQIKTQELIGGAERRQSILGFYVLTNTKTQSGYATLCF